MELNNVYEHIQYLLKNYQKHNNLDLITDDQYANFLYIRHIRFNNNESNQLMQQLYRFNEDNIHYDRFQSGNFGCDMIIQLVLILFIRNFSFKSLSNILDKLSKLIQSNDNLKRFKDINIDISYHNFFYNHTCITLQNIEYPIYEDFEYISEYDLYNQFLIYNRQFNFELSKFFCKIYNKDLLFKNMIFKTLLPNERLTLFRLIEQILLNNMQPFDAIRYLKLSKYFSKKELNPNICKLTIDIILQYKEYYHNIHIVQIALEYLIITDKQYPLLYAKLMQCESRVCIKKMKSIH